MASSVYKIFKENKCLEAEKSGQLVRHEESFQVNLFRCLALTGHWTCRRARYRSANA